MTSVPYPTFCQAPPVVNSAVSLVAAGRCRIYPTSCHSNTNVNTAKDEMKAIFQKAVAQSQIDDTTPGPERDENKKLKKKYMKQSVAMAQNFIQTSLVVDSSVIDIEIVLDTNIIVESGGCIVSCFLDAGCDKVVVPYNGEITMKALDLALVPSNRIIVHFKNTDDVEERVRNVSLYCDTVSLTLSDKEINVQTCCAMIKAAVSDTDVSVVLQVEKSVTDDISTDDIVDMVGGLSKFFGEKKNPNGLIALVDPSPQQLGLSYAACIRTDRPDGLYTTVVCTRSGEALGLVYSSKASIIAALECGRGVYYSRSRNGLWRKGDTSGHFQILHRIDVDCDGDALRFMVTQCGNDVAAFCHLNTLTCWGDSVGIRHLEQTLNTRIKEAPVGSYTKRLFDDEELLRDKLVEEAQELSEADTKQHVAEELADILYFAMVKATKCGVSIDDAVAELDKRNKKVTRRKGDSKAFRIIAGEKILAKK